MKKIVAFALAVLMIASCTMAFAENSGSNVTNEVSGAKGFKQIPSATAASSATQKTDMWLRVAASGQINCTIPLVLIYETNIDGGSYNLTSGYEITNNSTAQIAVTSLTVEGKDAGGITMVDWDEFDPTSVDEYAVKFIVNSTTYDLYETITPTGGKVFTVPKKAEGVGGKTNIEVYTQFSTLDFVTSAADATTVNAVADKSKGVKFLTVNYVVGIDTSTTAGSISGNAEGYDDTKKDNQKYKYSIDSSTKKIKIEEDGNS